MGTSLSGLTPATTFDGLLKVGDNDPLDGTLKTIGTGDGTDSVLQLSNSALQVNGAATINGGQATIVGAGNDATTTALLVQNSDGDNILKIDNSNAIEVISGVFRVRKASNNAQIFYVSETYSASAQKTMINSLSSPDASLQVKGSGTTSATASLLVQNSAGTDMLKVQDDSSLLMYRASNGVELLRIGESGGNAILYANGNANRSLVLGYENTLTAFNQSVFKTYNGTGYSEAMVITGNSNTSQFVGIGETTPTARLHVKGSGNDNTTISLLVQNSDGNTLLKADNGNNVYAINNKYQLLDSKFVSLGNNNFFGTSVGTAKVQIKGSGTTSATTSLLVQNSAGAEHLKVTDDGVVNVRSSLRVNHPTVSTRYLDLGWGALGAFSTNDELSLYGGGSTLGSIMYLNASAKATAPKAIGMKTDGVLIAPSMVQSSFAPDASAQLQVEILHNKRLPTSKDDRCGEGRYSHSSGGANDIRYH